MKRIYIILLILVASFPAFAQQSQVRIPGLERDSAYMACVSQDAALQQEIDALTEELAANRRKFRQEPENREQYGPLILSLEERLFTLRDRKGELIHRINQIEQEWILRVVAAESQPQSEPVLPEEETEAIDAREPRVRNLVANGIFRRELPAEDYSTLQRVQQQERTAGDLMEVYSENHALLQSIHRTYQQATDQKVADSLYAQMQTLGSLNLQIDDSLGSLWSRIFDHKSYAYAYLLDRLGNERLLEENIEALNQAQRDAENRRGIYASDALAVYGLQKQALVECEIRLAAALQLPEAQDSLRQEAEYLREIDFSLPRVIPERRFLLDYEAVEFSSPSKYRSSNAIPACKIYESGTIYRIRLGSYKYRQQLSIFRGVSPLCYEQSNGRVIYYAGGYATKAEARQACELLLKKGFRKPEIVRWTDGVREDVAMDEPEESFRVEIGGVSALSEEVRAVIATLASDKELTRTDQTFTVGGFVDRASAEELATALRITDGGLSVEVKSSMN